MYLTGEISPNTPRFQGQIQPDPLTRLEALIENLVKRHEDAKGMFRNQQVSNYNNDRPYQNSRNYNNDGPPQNQSDSLARLEGIVEKFVTRSTKRFEEIDSTQRNQQASIHNSEKQVGQKAQVLQERIPENLPGFTKTNPNAQVNAISTWSETTFSQSRLMNDQNSGARRDHKEQKIKNSNFDSVFAPYQPPIPFPERLNATLPEEGEFDPRRELEVLMEEEMTIKEQAQNEEHKPISMQKEQIFRIDTKVEKMFSIDEFDEVLEKEWWNSQAKKDEDEGRIDLFKDTIDTEEELRRIEELLGYSLKGETKEEECDSQVTSNLTLITHPQGANTVQDHKIQNSKEDNLKGNKKKMNDLVEEEKLKYGVVHHPKTNENFPKEVPPKPPEQPFSLIPNSKHTKTLASYLNKNAAHVTWEQTKKGKMGVEKMKPQTKIGYESRRDKWKEDTKGARGESMEGVKASPDANVTT